MGGLAGWVALAFALSLMALNEKGHENGCGSFYMGRLYEVR